VTNVRVIQDQDPTQAGDDFLRVSCEGDEATGVFTTIERVLGGAGPGEGKGSGWRLRRLFDGLFESYEAALRVAISYAEHKGVPVVYTETRRAHK
jgi:hypothetical protein